MSKEIKLTALMIETLAKMAYNHMADASRNFTTVQVDRRSCNSLEKRGLAIHKSRSDVTINESGLTLAQTNPAVKAIYDNLVSKETARRIRYANIKDGKAAAIAVIARCLQVDIEDCSIGDWRGTTFEVKYGLSPLLSIRDSGVISFRHEIVPEHFPIVLKAIDQFPYIVSVLKSLMTGTLKDAQS